jgi:hypothetical protein
MNKLIISINYEKKTLEIHDNSSLLDFIEFVKRTIPEPEMKDWIVKEKLNNVPYDTPIVIERWRDYPIYPNLPQVWYSNTTLPINEVKIGDFPIGDFTYEIK